MMAGPSLLVLLFALIVAQGLYISESQAEDSEHSLKSLKTWRVAFKKSFRLPSFRRDSFDERHDGSLEIGPDRDGAQPDSLVVPQEPRSDFEAKCLLGHEARFHKLPVLHFYARQAHSQATRGCGPNTEIELEPLDGEFSLKPRLDEAKIAAPLIGSQLFNSSAQTYIVTHGFMATWNGNSWMCDLKDLIFDHGDANVFILDWSGGSKPKVPLDYGVAVSNTQYVGALLGEFIRLLVSLSGQEDASHYHVIGHSLGAHISGYAGYYLNGKLGRITGLDPAGPCFKAKSKTAQTAVIDGYLDNGSRRLSRQSAQTVLVLHTDAPLFGLKQSCGHFDIYVNGGYLQPDCLVSLKTGLNPIRQSGFRAKLKLFLDKNLPCQHTYCYKIFKQLVNVGQAASWREGVHDLGDEESHNKCYLVAYQCSDWDAFKAGECGFCLDGEHECVLISPTLGTVSRDTLEDRANYDLSTPLVEQDDDDDQFNDESVYDGDPDGLADSYGWKRDKINNYSRGQHFMRAGKQPTICNYHYQIVVAVRRQAGQWASSSRRRYFYLDIPLERSGKLTDAQGNRLTDRLVQVSHEVAAGSIAYNNIRTKYMANFGLTVQGSADNDELDFYTALITFEPITQSDKCGQSEPTNGAGRQDKWQICSPLADIQEARLWSSSEANLEAVAWVGMNYMSGLNYKHRLSESYVFDRIAGQPISMMGELIRPRKLRRSASTRIKDAILNRVGSSAGCFLSTVDMGSQDDSETRQFKCDRSRRELIYAINLEPSKVGSRV